MPGAGRTSTRRGLPSVKVPVLSTTMTFTFSSRSMASALFTSTPSCAPRPTPTMMDIGVASPSAHGHAMMSTATALTMACARRGSGPMKNHSAKVSTATPSTAGTNQPATLSASAWIGARLRCASATICTIRASIVSPPTRSARMRKLPVPLIVPPVTGSSAAFSTGIGSPVSMDSSTFDFPSSTTPSTGILSPGRTRSGRAFRHLIERHLALGVAFDEARGGGREIQQRADRAAGAAAGAEFEHLAEQDEHDDHRRRLEVDADAAHRAASTAGNKPGASIATTL